MHSQETHEPPEPFIFEPGRLAQEIRWAGVRLSVAVLAVWAPDATRVYVLWALASRLRRVALMKAAQLEPSGDPVELLAELQRRGLLTRRVDVDREPGAGPPTSKPDSGGVT